MKRSTIEIGGQNDCAGSAKVDFSFLLLSLRFNSNKAEKPLEEMELQKREDNKDEKQIGKPNGKRKKGKGTY